MKSDPIYLSKALTYEASFGVLLVAGNVCRRSVSDVSKSVNGLLLKLALLLECLGDFVSLNEEKKSFVSIDVVLNYRRENR